MTQEDKQLLIKDLCGRLAYTVKINIKDDYSQKMVDDILCPYHIGAISYNLESRNLKPYLRPMSSITEEENEFVNNGHIEFWIREDYCNEHHLDYRGLIEKGLALEAPKDMYK